MSDHIRPSVLRRLGEGAPDPRVTRPPAHAPAHPERDPDDTALLAAQHATLVGLERSMRAAIASEEEKQQRAAEERAAATGVVPDPIDDLRDALATEEGPSEAPAGPAGPADDASPATDEPEPVVPAAAPVALPFVDDPWAAAAALADDAPPAEPLPIDEAWVPPAGPVAAPVPVIDDPWAAAAPWMSVDGSDPFVAPDVIDDPIDDPIDEQPADPADELADDPTDELADDPTDELADDPWTPSDAALDAALAETVDAMGTAAGSAGPSPATVAVVPPTIDPVPMAPVSTGFVPLAEIGDPAPRTVVAPRTLAFTPIDDPAPAPAPVKAFAPAPTAAPVAPAPTAPAPAAPPAQAASPIEDYSPDIWSTDEPVRPRANHLARPKMSIRGGGPVGDGSVDSRWPILVVVLIVLLVAATAVGIVVLGTKQHHERTAATTGTPAAAGSTRTHHAARRSTPSTIAKHAGTEQPAPTTIATAPAATVGLVPTAVSLGKASTEATVTLHNPSSAAIDWTATGSAHNLTATPASGNLAPGASATIQVAFDRRGLSEGTWRGKLTFGGPGVRGSVAVAADIAYGPLVTDLAADQPNAWAASGCTPVPVVSAKVFDDSGVGHVDLVWAAPGAQPVVAPMSFDRGSWSAQVPPSATVGTGQWHVNAYDQQGNLTSTKPTDLPVDACASANE